MQQKVSFLCSTARTELTLTAEAGWIAVHPKLHSKHASSPNDRCTCLPVGRPSTVMVNTTASSPSANCTPCSLQEAQTLQGHGSANSRQRKRGRGLLLQPGSAAECKMMQLLGCSDADAWSPAVCFSCCFAYLLRRGQTLPCMHSRLLRHGFYHYIQPARYVLTSKKAATSSAVAV
jgi:hypothetical protein